jgi:hypothetical protein
MSGAYDLLLALHVPAALAALASFWLAVSARKGGPAHRRSGRAFALAMAAAAASGAALAGLLVFDPLAARPPGPEVAAQAGAVAVAGFASAAGLLLEALGLDGKVLAAVGAAELWALLRARRSRAAWIVEHLTGVLGAGAVAHGAFAVDVANRFVDDPRLGFLAAGPVVAVFAAVIALTARRWHRRLAGPGAPQKDRSPDRAASARAHAPRA